MNEATSRRCLEFIKRYDPDRQIPILFFDDEPIEQILYGTPSEGGIPANLYGAAIACAETMEYLAGQKDMKGLIEIALELGRECYPLTGHICSRLIWLTEGLVPNIPLAVLPLDLSSLGPLFKHMWAYVTDTADDNLVYRLGGFYYRWHEHYGDYEQARVVLAKVIEITRRNGNTANEAVFTNNFAFEFLLERRWDEAIPLFEQAASLFEKSGSIRFQWANSKANSWFCRFETGDFGNEEKTEQELVEILHLLGRSEGYVGRKPLILLARLGEHQGDIRKAVRLVRRAIKKGSDGRTRFPELDSLYLKELEKKMHSVV